MTISSFYRVEVSKAPCSCCGSGGQWDIVDLEDVATSTTYESEEAALEMCKTLNDAASYGFQKGLYEG